jgi:HlyD family secretion protein
MANWRSRIVGGLVLAGAAAAAVWALMPQPVPVDMAVIDRGDLVVTVDEEARTRIRDIYTVSAPVAGKVLRPALEEGDPVTAAETIVAVLEPTAPAFLDVRARREAEEAVSAARAASAVAAAQLREAQSQLEFAVAEHRRAMELARRETIPQRQLEEARANLETAESRMASAEATLNLRNRELAIAQARLIGPEAMAEADGARACAPVPPADATVLHYGEAGGRLASATVIIAQADRVDDAGSAPTSGGNSQNRRDTAAQGLACIYLAAPADGTILTVNQKSEAVVAAGTPLVEIGDPRRLEIVAEVLSADAVRIRRGARASVASWGRPGLLEAEVRRVEPAGFTKVSALGIEEQRVRVLLDLKSPFEEWSALGHEFRVVIHIVVEEIEDAVLVPIGALYRRGDTWAAYVVEDGRAAERILEIGPRTSSAAVVVSGLVPGEAVILHPSDRIADGTVVTRRD